MLAHSFAGQRAAERRVLPMPMPRTATLVLLVLTTFAGPASAQIDKLPSGGMGSFKNPTQRAAESYSRGVKAKRKAADAKEPGERQKLYQRAKDELNRSVGYEGTFEAFLALGEVHLALGDRKSAAWACGQAQALRPAEERAKACIETATRPEAPAAAAAPPATAPEGAPEKPPGSSPVEKR
jgi:hypothetical protein